MARRNESGATDRDERIGEAIEAYLALAEAGEPPDAEEYAGRHPDLRDDLVAALEGLALVQGLVGGSPGSHGNGHGPGGRLESGRRIAGYRIVRELGRGGMGVVYEAVHVGLDRPVALKVLGTHAVADGSGRRRFLNEARTAAGLHHTHIVPVFDVGQVGALCYYAMQRIEGSGLDKVIRFLRRDRTTAAGNGTGPNLNTPRSLLGRIGAVTPLSLWTRGPEGGRAGTAHARGSQSTTGPWTAPAHPNGAGAGAGASAGAGTATLAESLDDAYGLLSATGTSLSAGGRLGLGADADRDDEPTPFEPPRGGAYYRWVAEVGRQSAEALGHAHRRGVIHRDIKPSNLLVDGRGLVWVADFGLARRLADPGHSHHESLIGTPRYMSPEQAHAGSVDGRTDLYSLGATLYELLTLRPPFEGRSAAELIEQIGHREPPAPRQFDPRIPRDLETIVLKLLSKRPAERYETAGDLADDLRRFLNLEPVRARRISPVGRLWRFARRRPGITAVTATAAATVLAVSTYAHWSVLRALEKEQKANSATRAAMRTQLWREAELVRLSNMPNRRTTGLNLIRDAVALQPDPALQSKLRDETLEFLVLRDVEARTPLPTGRPRGLTFGPAGTLAVVSDEGSTIGLWDAASGRRLAERSLLPPGTRPGGNPRGRDPLATASSAASASNGGSTSTPKQAPSARGAASSKGAGGAPATKGAAVGPPGGFGFGGGGPRGAAGGRPWGWMGPTAVAAGPCVAVIAPDSRGVDLYDASNSAPVASMDMPGHLIVGLHATLDGERLVTVELAPPPRRDGRGTARNPGAGTGPGPGGPPGFGERFIVNLWDPADPTQPLATLATLEPDGTPFAWPLVAVGPDGRAVAVARARKSTVSLFSPRDGRSLGAIETAVEITALALGPDNQLAVAGNGEVKLWETDNRTAQPSLAHDQGAVRALRFSPRGPLLAIVGWTSREIELWDTASHAMVAMLPTPEPLTELTFSPDGHTLAAGQGNTTRLWNVVDPAVRTRLSGFDDVTRSMAFRPADGLLALGSWRGTIRFWQAGHQVSGAAKEPTTSFTGPHRAADVAGATAAALGTLGGAAGAEPPLAAAAAAAEATGTTMGALARDRRASLASLAFDDQGRLVALDTEGLRVWNAAPRCAEAIRLPFPRTFDRGPMMGRAPVLGASRDGRALVVARGTQLFRWLASRPDELQPLVPPADVAASLARPARFGPGPGPPPATGPGDRDRDREKEKEKDRDRDRGRGRFGPPGWVALAVAPGGERLYLIDSTGALHAWALTDAGPRALGWTGLVGGAASLALSPDGKTLAVGGDGRPPEGGGRPATVTLVDTEAGTVRGRLTSTAVAGGPIFSMAFAPNGRDLAVGNQEGQVELWALDNPTVPLLQLPATGHKSFVASLAFDAQGRHLAAASGDRTVDVWDLGRVRDEFTRLGLAW